MLIHLNMESIVNRDILIVKIQHSELSKGIEPSL